jgi:hypothetical protein
MPRLVQPTAAAADARAVPETDTSWLERTAKYIPGEVIAAYKAAFAILVLVPDTEAAKVSVGWITFAVCLILTPVYLYQMNKRASAPVTGKPLWIQLVIATVSFVVWAYALGGPFAFAGQPIVMGGYREWIAGIILILYTLGVGAYKP